MHLPNFLRSISGKFILITLGIIIALGIVIFIWQNNKYKIVKDTIAEDNRKEN